MSRINIIRETRKVTFPNGKEARVENVFLTLGFALVGIITAIGFIPMITENTNQLPSAFSSAIYTSAVVAVAVTFIAYCQFRQQWQDRIAGAMIGLVFAGLLIWCVWA